MTKKVRMIVIGILLLLGVPAAVGGLYIVGEMEQVVITQFGEPKGDPVTTPGLHFKLPFIQMVNRFDKRFLEWDGDPNEVPTRDKRFIHVDSYARWQIPRWRDPQRDCRACADRGGAQQQPRVHRLRGDRGRIRAHERSDNRVRQGAARS
jgi:membrane protease subunit HflC